MVSISMITLQVIHKHGRCDVNTSSRSEVLFTTMTVSCIGSVVSWISSLAIAARVLVWTTVAQLFVDVRVACNKNDNKIISLMPKSFVTKLRVVRIRTEWLS